MTDTITKRLAEIREDFKHLRYDDGCRRLAAAVEKVQEWATSDLAPTAINEFGSGYREAMRDIRDLLAAALSDTRGGEVDG